ncbi:hypothetical protein [Streptomyces sp. NPDC001137]|uniref:hypothetical protein n=1 Tax=Streptomyces sp. NPDC001137 TaxID=3154378 RepID=UPI003333248F
MDARGRVVEPLAGLTEADRLTPGAGDQTGVTLCERGRRRLHGRMVMVGIAVTTVIVAVVSAVVRDLPR